jgi:localization factor PodJL
LIVTAALAGIFFTRGIAPGPDALVGDEANEVGRMFAPEVSPAPLPESAPPKSDLPHRPLTREESSPYLGPSAAWPEADTGAREAIPDVELPPASGEAVKPAPAGLPPRPATRSGDATAKGEPQNLGSTPPAQVAALEPLKAKAVAGDAAAALALGLKYLDGDGVAEDDAEAFRWISRAAQQGNAVAQYRLGTLYERGRGVSADAKKAHEWYLLSARQGNRKAMHNLAVSFAQGTGAAKNFAEAARWFAAAAELGLLDSQFNLAVLYERGMGVPPSLRDAYKWYVIAAAQGDAESKSRLDALATQLSPADREDADKSAQAFRPRPLSRAANDLPAVAQMR